MYLQLYIGCSGWSYDAWLGHFYPKRLESRRWFEPATADNFGRRFNAPKPIWEGKKQKSLD